MDPYQLNSVNESNNQNRSQLFSTPSMADMEQRCIRENVLRTTSSLLPNQVSHILSLFPSANDYDYEQYIAYPVDQRFTIRSSGTAGKAVTIAQPNIAQYVPLLEEPGFIARQLRRPEVPYLYEYKASAGIKQRPGATLRTTAVAMSGMSEEPQEAPINVSHARHHRSGGVKRTAVSISQIRVFTDYAQLDESGVHLGQLQRLSSPQSVTYRVPVNIRPSTGTILRTPSALGQEEAAQETAMHIRKSRQSIKKGVSAPKQRPLSIMQLTASSDLPILDETAVHLGQVHRPDAPQIIHYKPPAGVRRSIGSIRKTSSALGRESPAQEKSVTIAQLRQPVYKHLSAAAERGYGYADI